MTKHTHARAHAHTHAHTHAPEMLTFAFRKAPSVAAVTMSNTHWTMQKHVNSLSKQGVLLSVVPP